jgi:hypothetical protein
MKHFSDYVEGVRSPSCFNGQNNLNSLYINKLQLKENLDWKDEKFRLEMHLHSSRDEKKAVTSNDILTLAQVQNSLLRNYLWAAESGTKLTCISEWRENTQQPRPT